MLLKSQQSRAYYKRYQVKYKRRRQGKTDYRQRLRLTIQDKNKYATPKYRFVVRFSLKDITCQIVRATMRGDVVLAAAYSHELPKYGMEAGLTNYAAAYCTGLLLARRTLTKLNLADTYEGNTEGDVGEDFNVEPEDEGPRPFTCLLDVGLKTTSVGSRVFAALKGGLDGGLDIPHSEKRFFGYDPDEKELDTEALESHIYGGHIAEFMDELEEDEPEEYAKRFAKYIEAGIESDDLEDKYKEVHEAIRKNPVLPKKEKKYTGEKKKWQQVKKTYEQKKSDMQAKLLALRAEG